ncbi:MAG: Uma2 family endonuclease [Dehalococcoidia bacterium]
MVVSFATYERVALEDSDATWELVCGHLREKAPMTQAHNSLASRLVTQFARQLGEDDFEVRMNAPALYVREGTYLVPDVAVVPQLGLTADKRLEAYREPLPFVAEVWSPSTGDRDIETKIPEYRHRGDREIWQIHTRERSITSWQRQADGSYRESRHESGVVSVGSLPGVSISIDRLFR